MDLELLYKKKIESKKSQLDFKYSKMFDTKKIKLELRKEKELKRAMRNIDKWFANEKRNIKLKAKWKPIKKNTKTNWLRKYEVEYALSVVIKEAHKEWDSLYTNCISCGVKLCVGTFEEWIFKRDKNCQNWHHFSRWMHKYLYHDQRNTRPQCSRCNAPRWHSWNFTWYRNSLIKMFWEQWYNNLELDSKKIWKLENKYSDHWKQLYQELKILNIEKLNMF